jgi:pimeloyl-ACP methyl ester carboxylesterase
MATLLDGARAAAARGSWWWTWRVLLGLVLLYGGALLCGMQPAVPFDVALNLWPAPPVDESLRAPPAAKPRLVVLQHGLWRSPWSLWRLERALRAHGYAVLNPRYPSTRARIEQHAGRLRDAIEAWVEANGEPEEIAFVGHSMGGLVIEEYLRRPDARAPVRCVYVATPHRGAMLCDLRKHWWMFRLFMGTGAALQLSPGDPLHRQPLPFVERSGAIVGSIGAGNASIPGDDDGTVGVAEAQLAGAADTVTLPHGHTAIAAHEDTIAQVLHFLREGAFAR